MYCYSLFFCCRHNRDHVRSNCAVAYNISSTSFAMREKTHKDLFARTVQVLVRTFLLHLKNQKFTNNLFEVSKSVLTFDFDITMEVGSSRE